MNLMMKLFWPLLLLTFLSGCGDLFKNKVIKKEIDSSQFNATCNLDVDQFSKILSQNISSQIRCLGENLNIFIKFVETDKPGYMNRSALEAFLKTNRPDITPEILKALKAVYDLNYLLKGENREYISKANVDELIEFAVLFNAEASLTLYPLFTSKNEINFSLHDAQWKWVRASTDKIVSGLNTIFNKNPGNGNRDLDIIALIQSFVTDATADDIAKIMKALFVKKVLFGGERGVLTHQEVNERVLKNFGPIALSVFDIVKFQHIKDFTQEKIFDLFQRNIESLGLIVMDSSMGNRDKELFFTVTEAMDLVDSFVTSETFKIHDWQTLIDEAKHVFMGGATDEVRGLDFKTLLGHANNILKTGTVFYSIYSNPKISPALDSTLPVMIDFSEFKHTYPLNLDELEHFERIAKKYRFFRGKFESSYYTKGIRRNPDAMVETYMYEYLLKMVIKSYGSPSTSSLGGYGINRDQLYALVSKLERVLVKLKLITPQHKDSLTDNISLLATLFQYQSDKNGVLDANEATEFAIALITSMDISKVMIDYYKFKGCSFDKFNRVEASCFRQHFFKGLCESFDDGNKEAYRGGYRTYFPMMFEYIGAKSCDQIQNTAANNLFLDVSIKAARGCNYYNDDHGKPTSEEIYYSEGDMMTILMVLLHSEATTLRWDDIYNKGNGNNLLDAAEMDRAYEIYSPALDGFLADKPGIIKSLKKQIYQYLVKYETVPDEKEFSSIWKFVKFLVSFKKQAPAPRKTLASILYQIGEQNKKTAIAANKPQFDCNLMKDPDNIPFDPAPTAAMSVEPSDNYSGLLNYIEKTKSVDDEGEPVFEDKGFCLTLFKKKLCL